MDVSGCQYRIRFSPCGSCRLLTEIIAYGECPPTADVPPERCPLCGMPMECLVAERYDAPVGLNEEFDW